MITITTQKGVIEIPCPPADDAQSIQGNCGHGVSMFRDCDRCERTESVKPLCPSLDCTDSACRRDHQKSIENDLFIQCACGCGALIAARDRQGRARRFCIGHIGSRQFQKNTHWGHWRARKDFKDLPLCKCGQQAVDRHHKDGDATNTAAENISFLCRHCHMAEDGRLQELREADTAAIMLEAARRRIIQAGGNPDLHKICRICRKVTVRTDFNKNCTRYDGLEAACRSCSNALSRSRYRRLRNRFRCDYCGEPCAELFVVDDSDLAVGYRDTLEICENCSITKR